MNTYEKEGSLGIRLGAEISRENIIRFDALECRLYGHFGTSKFGPWPAVSGAGLNHHKKLEGTKLVDWLPSKAKTGSANGQRGGVIPSGWWIALPEILRKDQAPSLLGTGGAPTNFSIKIIPYKLDEPDPKIIGEVMRGGFYIHGRSMDPTKTGSGSDGCILVDKVERQWLANMIKSKNGAWLHVFINRGKIMQMIDEQLRPIA